MLGPKKVLVQHADRSTRGRKAVARAIAEKRLRFRRIPFCVFGFVIVVLFLLSEGDSGFDLRKVATVV